MLTCFTCTTAQIYFMDFQQNKVLFQILAKQVLVQRDLTGKLQPDMFLKTKFLVAGFTLVYVMFKTRAVRD